MHDRACPQRSVEENGRAIRGEPTGAFYCSFPDKTIEPSRKFITTFPIDNQLFVYNGRLNDPFARFEIADLRRPQRVVQFVKENLVGLAHNHVNIVRALREQLSCKAFDRIVRDAQRCRCRDLQYRVGMHSTSVIESTQQHGNFRRESTRV
jgi:hypothetical protein